jgi:hypothetical protein
MEKTILVRHTLPVALAALLIGAGTYMYVDPFLPAAVSNTSKGYETGYEAGFAAAKELVKNSNAGRMYVLPDDIRSLSGVVTAVEENRLTLRVPVSDPFEDASLAERTILIDACTGGE